MGDPTDEKHDIKNSPYWKGPHWGLTPMWSNQKTFGKIALKKRFIMHLRK